MFKRTVSLRWFSFEYTKQKFWFRNKKINIGYTLLTLGLRILTVKLLNMLLHFSVFKMHKTLVLCVCSLQETLFAYVCVWHCFSQFKMVLKVVD